MAVKLNDQGYDHARSMIEAGRFVSDERDDWSEHQPKAADENAFIEKNGISEFGLWHLAIDTDLDPETKGHWKFPYGDFDKVHRCALLAAETRAAQRDYTDVKNAAAQLHGMIEGAGAPRTRR
jgi:hypothetical protein